MMMLSNSILIFLSIVCLSVSSDIPINTNEKKTNTKSNLYDQQCSKQLTYFDSALLTRESWALEVFDTWTFHPRSKVDYGDFDQCIRFRHESTDAGLFQGQHCLIHYKEKSFSDDILLTGGICLPASCSANEILTYTNKSIEQINLFVPAVQDQDLFCHTNNKKPFSVIDFIAIIVLSIFGILLLLSSSYDIYMKTKKQKPNELYIAFSIPTNCKKLFDIRKNEDLNVIHCLHGLRALSILWIMFGDRYVLLTLTPIMNPDAYTKWLETIFSAIVNSHPFAVDTFLVMSGLLLTWSLMKNLDSKKFGVLKMYLHRYLRLTPVLAVLILFVVSLYRHIGSGGPYHTTNYNNYAVPCEKYWWSALLHIQNYFNPHQICVLNSWYLSIDFQLTLVSPIIVYPAWKYGWKFLWTLPVFITFTEICTFMISLKYNFKGFRDLNSRELLLKYERLLYYPTHIRMGAWLIGVMVGYQLYKIRNKKVVINKTADIVMWILSIGTFVAVVIGLLPLQQKEYIDAKYGHAMYLAFTKNNYAYALSWIICACHVGTGGVVRWFLSLQLWKPLGKMGLSFYLVHVLVQSIVPVKQPLYFNNLTVLYVCLGDLMVSFFFALVLYLSLEVPILIVEKYIYKKIG